MMLSNSDDNTIFSLLASILPPALVPTPIHAYYVWLPHAILYYTEFRLGWAASLINKICAHFACRAIKLTTSYTVDFLQYLSQPRSPAYSNLHAFVHAIYCISRYFSPQLFLYTPQQLNDAIRSLATALIWWLAPIWIAFHYTALISRPRHFREKYLLISLIYHFKISSLPRTNSLFITISIPFHSFSSLATTMPFRHILRLIIIPYYAS
jgi:hypothetical protein